MILVSKNGRSIFLLLAIVLCCLPAACTSGKGTGANGSRVINNSTSENQASAVISAETAVNALESTMIAAAAFPAEKAETAGTASAAENTAADAAVVQEANGNTAEAAADKAASSGSPVDSGARSGPSNDSEQKSAEPKTAEPRSSENDKLIGKDAEYSFCLDADNSVYALDSAGKRTECTMLSEYSGWADYFEFNSYIYICSNSTKVIKARPIPPGDMFLGASDFHIYYISADFSKAYSLNEDGDRHDSPIILYGGNYYFALDSSIYTVMTNGQDLKKLYSEHQIEIGPHNEHILVLSIIEDGIIYYSDESTGYAIDCMYVMAESKAYDIDPLTGKINPR